MEEFLLRLQESEFSVWVSSAPTLLAYPTILMLHTVGLAIVVGAAAVLDLRLLGFGARMPISALRGVFRMMWLGFAINASTGIALFISEADDKGMKWIFWVKMIAIVLALIVTSRLKKTVYGEERNTRRSADIVPPQAKGLAVASLAFWFAAIAAGRLMAYIK
jgi:hypothetical protein